MSAKHAHPCVSDEHSQSEDPKGLSGEAMPARSAQAETPSLLPLTKAAEQKVKELEAAQTAYTFFEKEAWEQSQRAEAAESSLLSSHAREAALVAENERLRAALMPFAKVAKDFDTIHPDSRDTTKPMGLWGISVGDLRCARSALAQITEKAE